MNKLNITSLGSVQSPSLEWPNREKTFLFWNCLIEALILFGGGAGSLRIPSSCQSVPISPYLQCLGCVKEFSSVVSILSFQLLFINPKRCPYMGRVSSRQKRSWQRLSSPCFSFDFSHRKRYNRGRPWTLLLFQGISFYSGILPVFTFARQSSFRKACF